MIFILIFVAFLFYSLIKYDPTIYTLDNGNIILYYSVYNEKTKREERKELLIYKK